MSTEAAAMTPSTPNGTAVSASIGYPHHQSPSRHDTPSKQVSPHVQVHPNALDPPKAAKIPTVVANYQSRWEKEKAKALAAGTDLDGGDPKMIGPWVIGEMLGKGASGSSPFSQAVSPAQFTNLLPFFVFFLQGGYGLLDTLRQESWRRSRFSISTQTGLLVLPHLPLQAIKQRRWCSPQNERLPS